jgi:hypothetical protein
MLKGPVSRGDKCVLEFGDLFFEVTPGTAGRVTSARIGTSELLTGPSVDPSNYGSTFWTSPQADWSWPPLPEMDTTAFTVTSDDKSCTVVGPKVSAASHPNVDGLSISKTFTADFAKQAVSIQYTIKNQGTASKRVAPWEITRVAGGGLTFYASDSAPSAGTMPLLTTTTGAGCVWFKHTPSVMESKLFGDGKGWIAHVTPQNVILIKSFPDIQQAQAATGEAEIEIYSAPPAKNYVEVENQGAVSVIPAGGTLNWTVRWYVRPLPSTIMATPGNEALVSFVTQTIQ